MTPFFSIIIPVYNRAHRLGYVLESLKKQTFQDFETIIIDDASTDNSFQVALEFDLPNKAVIRNERNSERCITRNNGIAIAKGTYICFLDSDDYHLPDHLQVMHDFIVEKECPKAFFFTNAWDEDDNGVRSERYCPNLADYDSYTYFLRYTVNPQRWAIHRDICQHIKFDENIVIGEDMDMSLRIVAANYPIFQLSNRTTVYVAAADSFTHGDQNKAEKELFYFKKIFSRPELSIVLPRKETNRLLSQCHFHIMQKCFESGKRMNTIKHGIVSFILCPRGYNGKTNKIVAASCIYSIPLIGTMLKRIKQGGSR